jgi:hypothetical protein
MKTNFLFFIQAYSDQCQTSTPSLSNFKWSRQIDGVPYTTEDSKQIQVLAATTSSNLLPAVQATSVGDTASTTTLTITGSTTGILKGQLVTGAGIPSNTFVSNIVGSIVTLSKAATATATGVSVSFYLPISFVYLESDKEVSVIYNGGSPMTIAPFQINGVTKPAVFFMNGPSTTLTVTNSGATVANIFFASMG